MFNFCKLFNTLKPINPFTPFHMNGIYVNCQAHWFIYNPHWDWYWCTYLLSLSLSGVASADPVLCSWDQFRELRDTQVSVTRSTSEWSAKRRWRKENSLLGELHARNEPKIKPNCLVVLLPQSSATYAFLGLGLLLRLLLWLGQPARAQCRRSQIVSEQEWARAQRV